MPRAPCARLETHPTGLRQGREGWPGWPGWPSAPRPAAAARLRTALARAVAARLGPWAPT